MSRKNVHNVLINNAFIKAERNYIPRYSSKHIGINNFNCRYRSSNAMKTLESARKCQSQ